ncbi:MAG TPA: aldo/keto reductase [Casimicrobiaceae bacterium]|nr:aldo/keto reductase [Casimicrobiaceae bacterium]
MIAVTRRQFTSIVVASMLAPHALAQADNAAVLMRAIPKSGERLPAVGLGTAAVFDRDSEATRQAAAQVVDALLGGGGRLIDTASTYGDAEVVLGKVVADGHLRERIFIATKLEEPDEGELKQSLARLRTPKLDLLQLHNVHDTRQSLAKFRGWQAQGICRYVGITSTYHSHFDAVEGVLAREKPDFVQVDYSLDERTVEAKILPLAADVGAGVLTALPFGRGRLFRAVRGKEIPDWARAFAGSWAQFFLKYLLADPRVTAVIPGTASPAHMTDNSGAMRGPLPDAAERKRMVAFIANL